MDTDEMEEDIDGCIHSIHVRNFFCHENLEVTFNRNVNFIVGRNGSGKSAILTALVVGLGGRASATNRGSNLHSFIRKGANSATVEIKIKNNSAKAFKPNVYGDYITIVRTINSSGGSSYKVKSSSGEVISTKFEEVNAIILAHDIQVDNPISVLNQDDARSFHASDAKKKYSLFRKATNLDQTEHNYVRAMENCEKATAVWRRKHEASLELEKELKKWETSYEQLHSRDEIESQKQQLQNEYYWSEIAELEQDMASVQAQYERQKRKLDNLTEKLNAMDQNFDSNNDTITALKTQLDEKNLEKTAVQQELQQLESEVRELQNQWRQTQSSSYKQNDALKREKKKLSDLDKELQNIESGAAHSKRAQLETTAAKAEETLKTETARHATAEHDARQAEQNAERTQQQADRHATMAARQRDKIKQLKQQLRELTSSSNDSLAVYGANMTELCRLVKQATANGMFSAPPKGPVGAYLKVKEKKWGGALEHILGGSIQSFCVNSPEDSRKLFEIMGKVYGSAAKPAVTCSKFLTKVHDVRRNKVHARGYVSALDALDISDPVIANYLIDNIGVESILLVPEHDDAVKLSDNVENVPENCAKIVTLDSTEYHPAPNYRSYGGAGKPSRYLHLSTAERKRQVTRELEECEAELAQLEAISEESSEAARVAREHERKCARGLHALAARKHAAAEAARSANAALQGHHAPHTELLLEERAVSQKRIEVLEEQMGSVSEKERNFKQKIDDYDGNMKRLKTKLAHLTSSTRNLSEEIDQEQFKLDQGVTERQMCMHKMKEDQSKVTKVQAILQEKKVVIDQKTSEALQLCQRVENPREKAVICSELKKVQLKLSSIRSDGLSKAQVAEKLLEVEKKYRRTKQLLDRLKVLIKEIKRTADKHLQFCHKVQTYIARRVQHCFQSILALRGYSGRMEIDNAVGTLEIVCTGRESSGKRHASSTSSLSGGERSYSTVAFIMALWDCVELPFYFMDEFDVFMDNVNRKIVMELLIDHALKNTNRQFVFLTPQDASSVVAGPQIRIHRMADPRQ